MKKITRKWVLLIVGAILIILILLVIFWPRKNDANVDDSYTCPTDTDWVNCMPTFTDSSDGSDSAGNSADYCKFVEDNCPDISVVY